MIRLLFGVTVLLMFFFLSSCCGSKPPEPDPSVKVKFVGYEDSDKANAWVIETEPGNPDRKLDSTFYGLLNHLTDYSFVLQFKKNGGNGDYHIFADSLKGSWVVHDVVVNTETDDCGYEVLTFSYRFNGNYYDQRTYEIKVHK